MTSAAVAIEMHQRSLTRIAELDGIRGIAILLVFAVHLGVPACPPGILQKALGMGWVGVDLFFVLSGFLITGILLDSKNSSNYFSRFYLRRVFRIFPIYYAFIILFFHFAPLIEHATGPLARLNYGRSEEGWYWIYLSNWRNAFQQNGYIRHFWSLSIEEQFYLVWPVVIYLAPRRVLKYLCVALAILSPVLRFIAEHKGVSPYFIYRATPFRLEGLALGALLGLAVRAPSLRAQLNRLMPFGSILAAAGLVSVLLTSGSNYLDPRMAVYGYTSVAVLCCVFVFRGIERSGTATRFAQFLRQPWLVRFGKYSYGLYVWHVLTAGPLGAVDLILQRRFGPSWTVLALASLVGIGGAYVAALLSWKFIEEPCARLKERLAA